MKRISFFSTRLALAGALILGAATTAACSDPNTPTAADFSFSPDDLDEEIVGEWTGTLVDDTGAEETFSVDLLRSGDVPTDEAGDALSSRLQCGEVSRTASTYGIACVDIYETRLGLIGTLESDVAFAKRIVVEAAYSVLGTELPAYNRTVVIELPQGAKLIGSRDEADNFRGEWTLRGGEHFGTFTMMRAPTD
jgi:hypothetical protein